MKALVISGGADKVAFGAGVGTTLHKNGRKYDLYIGTSAGALNVSMLSIGDFEALKEAVLTTKPDDVFDIKPFNKNGKPTLKALWRLLRGKPSLGVNDKFKEHIKKYYIDYIHQYLKKTGKKVYVGVTNYNTRKIEYPCLNDCNYEEAVMWLMASSQIPIATPPLKINDNYYFDGGVVDHVGIEEAIRREANEIDVILHRPKMYDVEKQDKEWKPKGAFSILDRTLEIMTQQISLDDVLISTLEAKSENIKIRFYFTPYKLTDELYTLNADTLKAWFQLGIDVANNKQIDGVDCFSCYESTTNKK